MTVYGINATSSDPTFGWADCKPEQRSIPKKVVDAWSNLQAAMADVDRLSNEEFLMPEISAAMKLENEARTEYARLYNLWQSHYWDDVLPDELQDTADESEAEGVFNWLAGEE